MTFQLYKQHGNPQIVEYIIANSEVITMEDMVLAKTNGFALRLTAGAAVVGVVVGIIDARGNDVFSPIATLGTATVNSSTRTVTVAADNQTVDQIKVQVNTSKEAIYSATVTGTMNTTSASNTQGGWVNADDEDSVDETTHTRTITAQRHLKGWGFDPNNTARMLVSIRDSEVWDVGGYNLV